MTEHAFSLAWNEIAIRLIFALALTGIIGWERERLRKPAGFRTHILVGLGACLVMMVSLAMVDLYPDPQQRVDPGRIAAQVVVGIGFLGAGTILRSKEGIVSGLTTAASLWVVSGIGLAVGCGFYLGASLTTVLVLIVLYFMNRVDDYVDSHHCHMLIVHARMGGQLIERIKEILRKFKVRIVETEMQMPSSAEKLIVVHFRPIKLEESKAIAQRLSKLPGVKEVSFN
jgi:putative Mg2+ transporter-C (MgtC) family protein